MERGAKIKKKTSRIRIRSRSMNITEANKKLTEKLMKEHTKAELAKILWELQLKTTTRCMQEGHRFGYDKIESSPRSKCTFCGEPK